MVFGGSFYSSIITYHLLKHILCVLTRLSQMPPFKLANLLRRITLLLATLLQGALSHHSNVRIQADVPYFLVYFPPLAEFLSANFKVKKKIVGYEHFLQMLSLCIKSSAHKPHFFSSGDLVRENLSSQSTQSRRHPEAEARREPRKPMKVRGKMVSNHTRLNFLKINRVYSTTESSQVLIWAEEVVF